MFLYPEIKYNLNTSNSKGLKDFGHKTRGTYLFVMNTKQKGPLLKTVKHVVGYSFRLYTLQFATGPFDVHASVY